MSAHRDGGIGVAAMVALIRRALRMRAGRSRASSGTDDVAVTGCVVVPVGTVLPSDELSADSGVGIHVNRSDGGAAW